MAKTKGQQNFVIQIAVHLSDLVFHHNDANTAGYLFLNGRNTTNSSLKNKANIPIRYTYTQKTELYINKN